MKKTISLLLAITVVFSIISVPVYADTAPCITISGQPVKGDITGFAGEPCYIDVDGFNETVTWTSSDPAVLQVDYSSYFGYEFWYQNTGTAVLTATGSETKTSVSVTVNVVNPYPLTLGKTTQGTIEYLYTQIFYSFIPETDGVYYFNIKSDGFNINSNIRDLSYNWYGSEYSAEHTIPATLVAGTEYILMIMTEEEGALGNFTVTVSDNAETPTVGEIIINNGEDISGYVGAEYDLEYLFVPDGCADEEIEWSSSDETVASVDQNGHITLLKGGVAEITAVGKQSGAYGTITVTVQEKICAESITIIGEDIVGFVGENHTLNYELYPRNCESEIVIWTSSDSSVVSVGTDGKINFHKKGNAEITVTTSGGLSDTVAVTVSEWMYLSRNHTTTTILTKNEETAYFKFTPTKSGVYGFYLETTAPSGVVDSDCTFVKEFGFYNSGTAWNEDCNFVIEEKSPEIVSVKPWISYWLNAGAEYYMAINQPRIKGEYSYAVTVKYCPALVSLEIYDRNEGNPLPVGDTLTVYTDQYIALGVNRLYNDGETDWIDEAVLWKSADEDVVIVEHGGLLTFMGEGDALITAYGGFDRGVHDSVKITVKSADKRLFGGDIDGDGIVDVYDMVGLKKVILGIGDENNQCDTNGDNIIDIRDIIRMKKYFADIKS